MAYAVLGYLDPATEQTVLTVWRRAANKGLATNPETEGLRPHVTLAAFDQLDVVTAERVLSSAVRSCLPCTLTFSHIGLFLGEQNVIFLAPTVTLDLLNMHRTIHDLCSTSGTGAHPLYAPGVLVPHATLALDLTPATLLQTIAMTGDLGLPLTGALVQIGVIEFRPIRHHFTLPSNAVADGKN